MLTLFGPVVLGNYFKYTFQNKGNILHTMLFTEVLFMIAKSRHIAHKKTNNTVKKWSKEVNRHITEGRCEWQTSTQKDALLITREMQIQGTTVITTRLSEGGKKKKKRSNEAIKT